jgi:tRNA U34 5-carboxymethylaminomethyl modifying GTPase MnmE/TrmE
MEMRLFLSFDSHTVHVFLCLSQSELAAEDLRHAVDALGRVVGRVDIEDVLDVLFHDFCIGK